MNAEKTSHNDRSSLLVMMAFRRDVERILQPHRSE